MRGAQKPKNILQTPEHFPTEMLTRMVTQTHTNTHRNKETHSRHGGSQGELAAAIGGKTQTGVTWGRGHLYAPGMRSLCWSRGAAFLMVA